MQLKKVFDFVEFMLINGDELVKDAMATCFLEYLLHQESEVIHCKQFVTYMGKQAIGYARAWDKFNGVRTEGLWDTELNE